MGCDIFLTLPKVVGWQGTFYIDAIPKNSSNIYTHLFGYAAEVCCLCSGNCLGFGGFFPQTGKQSGFGGFDRKLWWKNFAALTIFANDQFFRTKRLKIFMVNFYFIQPGGVVENFHLTADEFHADFILGTVKVDAPGLVYLTFFCMKECFPQGFGRWIVNKMCVCTALSCLSVR